MLCGGRQDHLRTCIPVKKGKAVYSCLWKSISQLRSVTCHMGSHSVTCHPTQVSTPRLNPSHIGWYSIYLLRRDGRLSWPRWLIMRWPGVEPVTLGSRVRHANHYTTKPEWNWNSKKTYRPIFTCVLLHTCSVVGLRLLLYKSKCGDAIKTLALIVRLHKQLVARYMQVPVAIYVACCCYRWSLISLQGTISDIQLSHFKIN